VVTTSNYQTVEIIVDPAFMMQDYGEAVARDLERRNPIRYKAVDEQVMSDSTLEDLSVESLSQLLQIYISDLARIRIQAVNGTCKIWREAKYLAIPPYIQFCLSQIGVVYDIDNGRKMVPCIESPDLAMSTKQLSRVTEYLHAFTSDGITLLYDAFPRDKEGDPETMTYAIIDGFIKGQHKASNPAKSYIAAFLGMKVRQESELRCLYSVQYDNVDYVKDRLLEELSKW
jgi:hypothetical protein